MAARVRKPRPARSCGRSPGFPTSTVSGARPKCQRAGGAFARTPRDFELEPAGDKIDVRFRRFGQLDLGTKVDIDLAVRHWPHEQHPHALAHLEQMEIAGRAQRPFAVSRAHTIPEVDFGRTTLHAVNVDVIDTRRRQGEPYDSRKERTKGKVYCYYGKLAGFRFYLTMLVYAASADGRIHRRVDFGYAVSEGKLQAWLPKILRMKSLQVSPLDSRRTPR